MTKPSKKFHNRTDAKLDMILCLHHATAVCTRAADYCMQPPPPLPALGWVSTACCLLLGADSRLKSVMHNISTSFALPLLFAILCMYVYILGQ